MMTRKDLHEIMLEAKGDQAPGSEPAWWGDYLEAYRVRYGVRWPQDDVLSDLRVDHTFAARWLGEAARGDGL